MADVLIVGGGPAGAVAAMILARQGVRVRVLDRARFPRPKLCGDTLNPGTLATLRRLGVAEFIDRRGLPIEGMIVTAHGVRVQAAYGKGICGRALERRELDWWLLGEAVRAGAQIEEQTYVRGAVIDDPSSASSHVRGVVVAGRDGRSHTANAPVTIAADGRHSTIAFGLGLARHPVHPRRWAIGQYFDGVSGLSPYGEMHIRDGWYVGVAPVPGGLANVCVVADLRDHREAARHPVRLVRRVLESDPELRERFSTATPVTDATMLSPLAVDATGKTVSGLLLAGDAASVVN